MEFQLFPEIALFPTIWNSNGIPKFWKWTPLIQFQYTMSKVIQADRQCCVAAGLGRCGDGGIAEIQIKCNGARLQGTGLLTGNCDDRNTCITTDTSQPSLGTDTSGPPTSDLLTD